MYGNPIYGANVGSMYKSNKLIILQFVLFTSVVSLSYALVKCGFEVL